MLTTYNTCAEPQVGWDLRQRPSRRRREMNAIRSSDPRAAALNARLTAVFKGEEHPKDNAERLELAYQAHANLMYASASRFFAEAFAIDPKVAADLERANLYNAACAATLAGTGQGDDDPSPDLATRAKLRRQALDWLKADLVARTASLAGGNAEERERVATMMIHWKCDDDLAGIREKDDLAKLPDGERKEFQTLWNEVDQLLARTATKE